MRNKIRNIFSLSETIGIINKGDFESKEITESVEILHSKCCERYDVNSEVPNT